jgi:hypothetical protein
LRVTFTRRRNDPALQITPEVSGDLLNWRTGAGYVEEVAVTPISAELERVTVRDVGAAPFASPRFLRLFFRLNE